jgi:hypothetical protein
MEKEEKEEWGIPKLDGPTITSFCLLHFPPSPFSLLHMESLHLAELSPVRVFVVGKTRSG